MTREAENVGQALINRLAAKVINQHGTMLRQMEQQSQGEGLRNIIEDACLETTDFYQIADLLGPDEFTVLLSELDDKVTEFVEGKM